MKFEKFNKGSSFTIGLELELRILDKTTLKLQNEYDYIYNNLPKKYKNNITCEFLASMIEINTPVFEKEKDLINYLKNIIFEISKLASKKSLCLQTSGSYAQKKSNIKLSNKKRYKELYEEHKILLDNFSICGTHVHIGFENFDEALKAYNFSIFYLPLFVALSSSSIFYDNKNCGIHSYRTKIFESLPKASIPEYFSSFEKMKEVYDLLHSSQVIESEKDIWWDVRIQPNIKTLEFRICDAMNELNRIEVIISLIKGLCKLAQKKEVIKLPMQILKQNMWSATRYSMAGEMITSSEKISIKKQLKKLAKELYDNKLISKKLFDKAIKIINSKSISQKMLDKYYETKSLIEVERIGVFE